VKHISLKFLEAGGYFDMPIQVRQKSLPTIPNALILLNLDSDHFGDTGPLCGARRS
jgi:hypothetical protein